MNRRFLVVSAVAGLVALFGQPASADLYTYSFIDQITWSGNGEFIKENQGPFTYEHDITDDVELSAGHRVLSAELEVSFTDKDNPDEFVQVAAWDGTTWVYKNLGDVGTGEYEGPAINADWLTDAGKLSVQITVTNPTGDVQLKSSTLSGVAVVPVPAAVVIGMLGLGVAGVKLRKFV